MESFGQNYPRELEQTLDSISLSTTCAFNRFGSLLAVGCNDGRIVIWDFVTRSIAKIMSAHVHPVCSLSWSRNGRKLLSSSTDFTVRMWDVLSGDCENYFRMESVALRVQFNPRNDKKFLVFFMQAAPYEVHLNGSIIKVPLAEVDQNDLNIVGLYERRGQYIYTGNSKGRILVVKVDTMTVVSSFRIAEAAATSNTAVRSMEFARRGGVFLINCADGIIRIFDCHQALQAGMVGELEPIQKLQDLVGRLHWRKCCFSGDGEYICAGSMRQQSIYIWERISGTLITILERSKSESILDVAWHPCSPTLASVSDGLVSIWGDVKTENWSAYEPNFKELDENVEYEERESEFDLEDEDRSVDQSTEEMQLDEEIIDVLAVKGDLSMLSSDEECEDPNALLCLPYAPYIENPEDSEAPMKCSEDPQPVNAVAQVNAEESTLDAEVLSITAAADTGHASRKRKLSKVSDSRRFARARFTPEVVHTILGNAVLNNI